jgi:hypothetical protein
VIAREPADHTHFREACPKVSGFVRKCPGGERQSVVLSIQEGPTRDGNGSEKARLERPRVGTAALVVIGVSAQGRREVLGMEVIHWSPRPRGALSSSAL